MVFHVTILLFALHLLLLRHCVSHSSVAQIFIDFGEVLGPRFERCSGFAGQYSMCFACLATGEFFIDCRV